jgi:hypothetical protein
MATRPRAPRLVDQRQVEGTLPPQPGNVPQCGLMVDEASKGGLDRCLDGLGTGHGPGPVEELIIDFDKSLGHW